jgi:hypothetical protein
MSASNDSLQLPPGGQEFVDKLLELAGDSMTKRGWLPLTAYLLLENGSLVPPIADQAGEPEERDAFSEFVCIMTAALPVSSVAIVMEAWSLPPNAAVDPEELQRTGIAVRPDRIEVVSILCHWPTVTRAGHAPIRRDADGEFDGLDAPTWNTIEPGGVDGRFGSLIPDKPVTPEIRALARLAIKANLGEAAADQIFATADKPRSSTH